MAGSPQKTIEVPEWGELNYGIDSWNAEIAFDRPPIETAHLHLRGDEAGPTLAQRQAVQELFKRHNNLWPAISQALVKCHPEINSAAEFSRRIEPHLRIDLFEDASELRLSFRFVGDPHFRAYFITLRNWEIVEVVMAE